MGTHPIYVPMLKGKEGEFAALEALSGDVKPHLMPLIEFPGVPFDYANERPSKSLDEHVEGLSGRLDKLQRIWPNAPLYLHLPWFGEGERLKDGRVALESVLADCMKEGINAVPVVSRSSSHDEVRAAARYSANAETGACVRLFIEDFKEDIDLDEEVGRLWRELGSVGSNSLDVIIDLGDLHPEANLVARSVLSMIPEKDQWRRMILAAASFPEDLSDVGAATTSTIPRREWELWKTLQRRPNILPRRDLIFGDYAIAHPLPKELDPRIMQMSASIRYTTPDDWLVVKGRNVRQYGFDQYFELCKTLIGRPEYSGRDFSWGDRYIDDCANGMLGPGNATTWRKVGTNHHLTLVTRELAKLRPGA
jgi:hypothetical protein